ncbi:VWA domain-containing protein [Bradyrhizobium japonicum]
MGRLLASGPYQQIPPDGAELQSLVRLVRRWIGGIMLEFAWPWLLLLLPLPVLAWWLLPPYRARQASIQVPFFDRLAAATGQTPQRGAVVLERRAVQMIAAAAIWTLLVVALARPQWVGDAVTREVSARDLILAIDISGSMDQRDFKASDGTTLTRLDGVKRVVRDFIARRKGDRVALILFGTRAYVQVPFTQDLQTAQQLLDQAGVGMAGQQTAIGDTIGLAIKTFAASTAKQKLLILLTDGNDTASRVPPEHAADIARQNDVTVYTIGVGDPAASGENRVDLAVLQHVADTTGGHLPRRGWRAAAGDLCRHRPPRAGQASDPVMAAEAAAVSMAVRPGHRDRSAVVALAPARQRVAPDAERQPCVTRQRCPSISCARSGCSR